MARYAVTIVQPPGYAHAAAFQEVGETLLHALTALGHDVVLGPDAHAVNRIVHDSVARFAGSISAEHGLGQLRRDEIRRYKSPVELELMRAIKRTLDPLGIMNPGKVL